MTAPDFITIAPRPHPTRREVLVSSPLGDTILFWDVVGTPGDVGSLDRLLDDGLIAVLPIAERRGWDIRIAGPVSRDQLANAMELIDFLATTNPTASRRIDIRAADVVDSDAVGWPRSVAMAFDGGVASTYAAFTTRQRLDGLRANGEPAATVVAVTVLPAEHARAEDTPVPPTHPILAEVDIRHVRVLTNSSHLDLACEDRLGLWRSAAMHQLSGYVDGAILPSEESYAEERHEGGRDSRADHLAFSQSFPFVTSGRSVPYLDKLRVIAPSATVRSHLSVCRRRTDGSNCRRCPDCVRATLALAHLGYPATPALGPVGDLQRPIDTDSALYPLSRSDLLAPSSLLAPSLAAELTRDVADGDPIVHARLVAAPERSSRAEAVTTLDRMHTVWRKRLDDLGTQVTEALRSALRGAESVAFVNYPDIENIGDPLLWMGAREALDSLGIGIAYSSDHRSYDPSEIARLPTDIPILVNGGGNFGDVWEGQHGVRLDVFERFTDRRIVQLPQSLFYRDPSLAKRESEIFRRHPDHTLMWRDDLSRSRAEALMGDAGILVPDTAFAARLPFAPFRGDGVQWILRSDQESILGTQPASGPGQTVTDWQTDPMPPALGVEMLRATLHAAEAHHSDAAEIDDLRRAIAALRIRRGAAIVRRGSATVTDRLHGLILSVLCGIPVVALDNESGKVHGVATRSLGSLPFVEQANDPMTAALIAERFASTVSDAGMGPKTAATR